MRISTTERQLLKRCRRKWDLSSWNRQALTPIVNSAALDFGTIWHAVLAQWTQEPSSNPESIYNDIAANHLSKIQQNYLQRIGCNPSLIELTPILEAIQLGHLMLQRYQEHWHTPLPPGFTLVDNELALIQDIPNTEYCGVVDDNKSCQGCPCRHCGPGRLEYCNVCVKFHQLECTFDGVMADANGDLFIIERKTFARSPNLEELNHNDQFLAYMWALSQQFPNVVGVAYDGALKNIKKPLDESFLRRILLRSQDELASFQEHLTYEANMAAHLNSLPYNHPELYPTVPPVMGCQKWECSFIEVCHTMEQRRPTDELLRMFTKSDYKRHLDED